MKTLRISIDVQYGTRRVRIVDNKDAEAVQALTGCKTLTSTHMKALEALGFVFELVEAVGVSVREHRE